MKICNKLYVAVGLAAFLTVAACVSQQKTTERNLASIGDIFRKNLENNSMIFSDQSAARRLTSDEIRKMASSSNLKLSNAEVIIDNDRAFDAKIEAIKNAKKEIRMIYFIYSNDDSSSVINRELIKKAQEGVKVKIIVDVITNYANYDLFAMMTREGKGNIEIRFYNYPSAALQDDVRYLTLPCPSSVKPMAIECQQFKENYLAHHRSNELPFFTKMFLSGAYGKSATALKIAMTMGAQIDPADFKSSTPSDPDETTQLIQFFKLMAEAKIKKDIGAMIKFNIAMAQYGDKLNPIVNQLSGRLPIFRSTNNGTQFVSHTEAWDHFTDYTHHKLIVVDGKEFELGGRNIEDSYHMKSRLGTKGKYIFKDTDFHGTSANGGLKEIENSYDKMFSFKEMVIDMNSMDKIMPFEIAANPEALGMAAQDCYQQMMSGKIRPDSLEGCIEQSYPKMPTYRKLEDRINQQQTEMQASADNYLSNYAAKSEKKILQDNWKMEKTYLPSSDDFSVEDLKTAEIYYIENTPYGINDKEKMRKVGSRIGAEATFNKNIHALWYRGLENVCRASRDEKKELRVILHSAYLFLPSGMIHKLAKMLNGDYGDCSRVRVTLITNSFETTDLNVINIFARYQLSALFKHYYGMLAYEKAFNKENEGFTKYKRWFPKLDYFEYKASHEGSGISLHTKLSILGDDAIIGSANADIRSYYMDTNNAVFVRNAKDFNKKYIQYIDAFLADSSRSTDWSEKYALISEDQIKSENIEILKTLLAKFDKKNKVSDKRQRMILKEVDELGEKISYSTQRLLNFRGDFEKLHLGGEPNGSSLEMELNKIANDFDDFFKVL